MSGRFVSVAFENSFGSRSSMNPAVPSRKTFSAVAKRLAAALRSLGGCASISQHQGDNALTMPPPEFKQRVASDGDANENRSP